MAIYNQNATSYFPRQVGEVTLEFDDWAHQVRQQMMACLQRRRKENEEKF